MPHRTRSRSPKPAAPSATAGLDGLLTLLERGVHVLPFLRAGDDALCLVAVNGRGRAVCNTPVCIPLLDSDEAVVTLRAALDAADPVDEAMDDDTRMVAELLDRALFATASTQSRPQPTGLSLGGGRLDGHVC